MSQWKKGEIQTKLQALGKRIRQARDTAGFSQERLAELSRIDQATISQIEKGRRLTLPTLWRVSIALNVKASSLMEGM